MKAIIFDMDGMITDSEKYWSLVPLRLLEYLGLPDEGGTGGAWFRTSHGQSIKNYMEMFPGRISMSFKEAACWCRNYMYTNVYSQGVPIKPQAMETMKAVQELGVPTCLLSATQEQALQYTLHKLNLLPYFDFWISTCDTPLNKHHVELFASSAQRMGVPLSECAVFEDSLYSMITAKKAGCKVWAMADDKHLHDRDEIRKLADRYFESHIEMSKAVREHFLTD